jgi:hypothetical protein
MDMPYTPAELDQIQKALAYWVRLRSVIPEAKNIAKAALAKTEELLTDPPQADYALPSLLQWTPLHESQ